MGKHRRHFMNYSAKLGIVLAVVSIAACGSDSDEPTQEDYDDVATAVAPLIAGKMGDTESMGDAIEASIGNLPPGFTRSGAGRLWSKDTALDSPPGGDEIGEATSGPPTVDLAHDIDELVANRQPRVPRGEHDRVGSSQSPRGVRGAREQIILPADRRLSDFALDSPLSISKRLSVKQRAMNSRWFLA